MTLRKKLSLVFLVMLGALATYLVLAKNTNLWPFQKPKLLVIEEQLEKKYGPDYKPIHIYIKAGASEEQMTLLKNQLNQYPEVIAVEEIPWPQSPTTYSAALKLVPMVKRDPQGFEGYPSNILEFLDESKTNPSSSTNIINNWSLRGEPNEFFDLPI